MTVLRAAMLGGLVLAGGSQAFASDEDVFVSVLKRFGVTDSVETGKKPCLCIGGNGNGNMGILRVYGNVGGSYGDDCEVPYYDAQGVHYASRFCMAQGGTSFVVLPK